MITKEFQQAFNEDYIRLLERALNFKKYNNEGQYKEYESVLIYAIKTKKVVVTDIVWLLINLNNASDSLKNLFKNDDFDTVISQENQLIELLNNIIFTVCDKAMILPKTVSTPKEIADYLKLKPATIISKLKNKKIKGYKVDNKEWGVSYPNLYYYLLEQKILTQK